MVVQNGKKIILTLVETATFINQHTNLTIRLVHYVEKSIFAK